MVNDFIRRFSRKTKWSGSILGRYTTRTHMDDVGSTEKFIWMNFSVEPTSSSSTNIWKQA